MAMIEGITFFLIWIELPILWLILLRVARVSLNKISIPSVLIIFIVILQYAGIPLLYFKIDKYRVSEVTNSDLMLKLFILSSTVITLLIIGFMFARYILGTDFRTKTLSKYYSRSAIPSRFELQFSLIILFSGIIGLVLYVNVVGLANIALSSYAGFSTLGEDGVVLRSNMGNAFEGRYYLYKFFMRDLLVVGSMALFAINLLKRSKLSMLLFVISFLVCALSLLLASEKAPILHYIIGLGFCYIMVSGNGIFSVRQVLFIAIVLSALVSLVYIVFMGAQSPLEGLLQGASRGLTGQIQPLYHYLEVFPDRVDYLLGRSMPNPMGLLPFEHYNLTVEVMNIVQPWHVEMGVIGTMPTFFWGELYANFSYFGVLLFPVFVGFAVCLIADILDRIRPTPIVIAIIVWVSMHIKNMASTSLSNYLLDFYSLAMMFTLVLAVLYSGFGRLHYRTSLCSR